MHKSSETEEQQKSPDSTINAKQNSPRVFLSLACTLLRRRFPLQRDGPTEYNPRDYEILLTKNLNEAMQNFYGVYACPQNANLSPSLSLLEEFENYTRKLLTTIEGARQPNLEGIKGHRAVFISVHGGEKDPSPNTKPISPESMIILFYVIPVSHSNSFAIDSFPNTHHYPCFRNLQETLHGMYADELPILGRVREMISSLDRWLRQQHAIPQALPIIFAESALSRVKISIRNPQFDADILSRMSRSATGDTSRFFTRTPSEEGVSLERRIQGDFIPADRALLNPLFESGLVFGQNVKRCVLNPGYGKKAPDYENIGENALLSIESASQLLETAKGSWLEKYPLHRAACQGDDESVKNLLRHGYKADELDSDSWTSLHYAAWHGHTSAVKILIQEGHASVNIATNNGSNVLHFAALNGHAAIVAFLLQYREVKRNTTDNEGKNALELCRDAKQKDWEVVAKLLEGNARNLTEAYRLAANEAYVSYIQGKNMNEVARQRKKNKRFMSITNRASAQVNINFIDGNSEMLTLPFGKQTTVDDILYDLYEKLELPKDESVDFFAIWLESQTIHLQLLPSDKPLQILSKFQGISRVFSESPQRERPSIYFRRNLFLLLDCEKSADNEKALAFLYWDAKTHVVNGRYLCSVSEAIRLASFQLLISLGAYKAEKCEIGSIAKEMSQLLPARVIKTFPSEKLEIELLKMYEKLSSEYEGSAANDLYRSYLEICWKWPYYGASFFHGFIQKTSSKVPIILGLNEGGFHLIKDGNLKGIQTISYSEVDWDSSQEKSELILVRSDASLIIHTKQASIIDSLATEFVEHVLISQQDILHASMQDSRVWGRYRPVDQKYYKEWQTRFSEEIARRKECIEGCVTATENGGESKIFLAQAVFFAHLEEQGTSQNVDLHELCYKLGYEVETDEIVSAEAMIGTDHSFSFKHFVSWWNSFKRSWLFLLDDQALRQRQKLTIIFEKFQESSGKVSKSNLKEMLSEVTNSSFFRLKDSIQECLGELEKIFQYNSVGYLKLNEFIDWLAWNNSLPDKCWAYEPIPRRPKSTQESLNQ